jgi:hypothetical protein
LELQILVTTNKNKKETNMPTYTLSDSAAGAPIFVTDATTGEIGTAEYNVELFFFDTTEIAAEAGCPHTGCVSKIIGTGGKAGQIQWEVIVAV